MRISVRDLVEDGKSLLRNSGVGGGGENLILSFDFLPENPSGEEFRTATAFPSVLTRRSTSLCRGRLRLESEAVRP